MGGLDGWIEHVEKGWRTYCNVGNGWVRACPHGNWIEDQAAQYVSLRPEKGAGLTVVVDLSGERVEIPSSLVAGPPPPTVDFFFGDPW